jgi:outer membrane protein assembly factor BamB
MKTLTLLFSFIACSASAQLIPDSLWSVQSERYGMGNPLLEEGIYYTGTEKGVVSAISIADGKVLWRAKVGGGMYHNIVSTETDLILPCAKHGDAVVSLNKKTGKQNWQIENRYNFDDDVPCLFVKDGDQVIFNSLDSTIVSLDPASGKELWKFRAGGLPSPPVLYGKTDRV